jgi:AcrR family transcriptional regulator
LGDRLRHHDRPHVFHTAYDGRVMSESSRLPLGRPRDRSIDARVLEATRALLRQNGFDQTTMRAIADTSGVHASAIYRRWRSRVDVIEEAVFPGLSSVVVRPTGDVRRDLRRLIRSLLTALGAPEARAAMPGLLASYQTSQRSGAPEEWLAVSARPQFLDILIAAPEGSIDPRVDPDDAFDMLLGAVLARTLVPTVAARNRPVESLVDAMVRLLQPISVPLRRSSGSLQMSRGSASPSL